MTREECMAIVKNVIGGYPTHFRGMSQSQVTDMVNSWYVYLCNHDINDIVLGLQAYVEMEGSAFPPSAPQLIEMYKKCTTPPQMDASDAWNMVRPMIRRGNYYAEEDFQKLPELVKKCIGGPAQIRAWASMPSETIDSVVSSNFLRTYEVKAKAQAQFERLPMQARLKLAESGVKLLEGTDG